MKSAPVSQLRATQRIAGGRDRADPGLSQYVLLDASHRYDRLIVDDASLVVCADCQTTEVRVAGAAVHLGAAMIGTSCPSTSPMRRLKQDVFAQPETEPEDIVSLEEERALLGKEWKPA